MMIDRKARDILAENFRHLITGHITNDEFEDRLIKSSDAGVSEVFYNGAWPLYDDLHEHKLSGEWAIAAEGKPIAARYILFLKTDLEYGSLLNGIATASPMTNTPAPGPR